jgi:prepilin-type N-terminal cleavage/methylation domain-containing protein
MKNSGFTLTEIIVSIVVLGIIIGGAVRTFGITLHLHGQNEKQVIANYLAQECLEIIRNNRDTNWLQNNAWDYGLSDLPALATTDFTRTVIPKTLESDEQQAIAKEFVCTITWNNGESQLSAAQILTNWQQ